MNTLETLKAARSLISEEEHWCKGEYALDGNDMRVGPNSYKAYSYCSVGAICRVTKRGGGTVQSNSAYKYLEDSVDAHSVADFNDSHTHAQVLAAFDAAIAKLDAVSDS